jgi:hypothetical protein
LDDNPIGYLSPDFEVELNKEPYTIHQILPRDHGEKFHFDFSGSLARIHDRRAHPHLNSPSNFLA